MSSRPVRGRFARIGAWAFAGLLALPLLGHALSPPREISALENRTLANPPALADAAGDWPSFPGRVSEWLEDRFGFRDQLLSFFVALDRRLQIGAERLAVRGDDGWLFLTNADSLLSHQGRLPFRPGEADAWLARAAEIAASAEAAGARFVVLVPPDKQTVYPERLSAYPRQLANETRLETLERLAPERGIAFVSPLAALQDAKSQGEVYFKTDTHWAPLGAFVAYSALIDALREMGAPVEALEEERIDWTIRDDYVGDLYGILGEANGAPESYLAASIAEPAPVREIAALPSLSWEGFESRRIVMEPRGRPSVLVLGDSFSDALLPFLQESFDEVTFAHHRLGGFPPEAIEAGAYDVVVLEIVERFLNRPLSRPAASD